MDENNSQFKEEFKLLLEKTIFPEDINEEERSRKWSKIINYIIPHIPKKLYRFRAYNENNVNSLKDETISLIRPDLFPDIYDSLIYVDTKKIDSLIKEALDPNSISAFINHCREKKRSSTLICRHI